MSLASAARAIGPGAVWGLFAVVLAGALAFGAPSVMSAQDTPEPGSVVVTTEVLGAIVTDLVGDAAEVIVLMEGGANPHTFEPSARDVERLLEARPGRLQRPRSRGGAVAGARGCRSRRRGLVRGG